MTKYEGKVVALGKLDRALQGDPDVEPRQAMVLVEWPSREAFQGFLEDPNNEDLHPLREDGTRNYLWWSYDSLEDLRPLFQDLREGSNPDDS